MNRTRTRSRNRNLKWKHLHIVALFLAVGLPWATGCSDDGGQPLDGSVDGAVDGEMTGDARPDSQSDGQVVLPFEVDPQRVYDDVSFLSSDQMAGRLPGSAENEAALQYVEERFADLGLVPAGDNNTYRQSFQSDTWLLTGAHELTVDGTDVAPITEYTVMQFSGGADVTSEIVFVGYGLTVPPFDSVQYPQCPLAPAGFDEYDNVDVSGKIVLVLLRWPDNNSDIPTGCPTVGATCLTDSCLQKYGYKSYNAALHGAAAVILIRDFHHSDDGPNKASVGLAYHHAGTAVLSSRRDPFEQTMPDLRAWAATIDAALIPESTPTGVMATVRVSAEVRTDQTANVLGVVEGTDPQLSHQVIVVGAHVDHIGTDPSAGLTYNGADDNASGSAVMMELARGIAHPHFESARTVLFASWNAEEQGLLGSCHYVANPVYPLADTLVTFSIDMVGGGVGQGIYLIGGSEPENQWLLTAMRDAVTGLPYSLNAWTHILASDHKCFVEQGTSGVLVMTLGDHPYQHDHEDTIDHILIGDLEAAARMMWASVEALAGGS